MVNLSQLRLRYAQVKKLRPELDIRVDTENKRAIADDWLLNHYGNFCSLGEPIETDTKIKFPILADMPIRIDEEEDVFYRWVRVGKIGMVTIDKNKPFRVDAPSLSFLVSQITGKYAKFRDQLEIELINAAEFKFALIDDVKKPFLNPFLVLIHLFKERIDAKEKDMGIPLSKILGLYKDKNYLDFFLSSGLVYKSETEEGYKIVPSEIMLTYREQASKDSRYSFEERCLGKIIIMHYPELSKISHGLKSYARFTNSLFEASYERQRMLKVTPETWVDKIYKYRYGNPSNRENMRIWYPEKLEEAGIIDHDNGKYYPNEDVYESYLKRINETLKDYMTLDTWGIF
ncbi:MAG: hypothetical protein DRN17_00245 [Thermoplasmata archaeon]|nr:MAG: hypothetical protein DRN17_00245 [Thermoplasmata archaeon]